MAEKKSQKKTTKKSACFSASSMEEIKQRLKEKHACYVLITCSEPSEKGEMQVELAYEGDETLAAYLVESAQSVFDQKLEQPMDIV